MKKHTIREFISIVNDLAIQNGMSPGCVYIDSDQMVIFEDLMEPEPPYIFERCPDVDAKVLLECFLLSYPHCEWELNCQLARLAATRGKLVLSDAIEIIDAEDWTGINPRQLLLAFIAVFPDFKKRLANLLQNSMCDFRDGLYIACKYADDPEVDMIICSQFKKWSTSDDWPVDGTGEAEWRDFFMERIMRR